MFVEETAKFEVHCHRKHGTMESPHLNHNFSGISVRARIGKPRDVAIELPFYSKTAIPTSGKVKVCRPNNDNVDVSTRFVKKSGALVILKRSLLWRIQEFQIGGGGAVPAR